MSSDATTGSAPNPGQAGAAFCFRLKQERPGWNVLLPVPSKATIDLAALVCGAPEFLGMNDGAASCQAAVVLSERGDARVVAAVDEVGGVSLVGCPAQLTRGALTAVTQELLVFNGRLWRMPPEEFSAVFEKRLGRSLGDYFSSRADIGWSENGFRSGLRQSLERGLFPTVLLLTESNQDVAEAVAHLKSHNLTVKSLGVELYESHGVEIVVPSVLAVTEPGTYEEREPAKLTPRPTPPQFRTPPRSQPSTAGVAEVGAPETAPTGKAPWSDRPARNAAANEAAPVEQVADSGMPESELAAPAPVKKMPWSDQPAPPVAEIEPPPVEAKPVTAVPPAPKPAPPARPVWDGTMPGVMAGKRPPRRSPQDYGTQKGHEQARERHQQ